MGTSANEPQNNDLGRCLVTGAAGFVGSHLVKALLERGCRVRALIRNTPLGLEHPNLEYANADIQNADQMALACTGVDTVFHTAAFIATLGGSGVSSSYREQAFSINVDGTRNIIKACQDSGVRKLVHTSSVDVCFSGKEDLHMDEDTPYATRFTCLYTETKIEAERAVLAANNADGLLTCALRPDGIWGVGGSLMLDTLVQQLRDGKLVARIGGRGGLHDHVNIAMPSQRMIPTSPVPKSSPGAPSVSPDWRPSHWRSIQRKLPMMPSSRDVYPKSTLESRVSSIPRTTTTGLQSLSIVSSPPTSQSAGK